MEMSLSVNNKSIMRSVAKSAVGLSLCSVLLGLSGCGYYASRTAHKAQLTMIGMTEEDIQACAGVPNKTQSIDSHVKIFEYQRGRNIGASTSSTLIPVQSVVNVVRDIGGGDGNSCIADFRMVDGKVHDVYYSGDDDMLVGTDGVCSTIVRGCIRRAVPSGSPPRFWKTSAFAQPQPDKAPATPAVPVVPATNAVPGAVVTPPASVPGATPPVTVPATATPVTLPAINAASTPQK